MLNIKDVRSSVPDGDGAMSGSIGWEEAAEPLLKAGDTVGTPEILFKKVDDDVVAAEVAKLQQISVEDEPGVNPPYKPLADQITFDDFTRLDLRVATILTAEKMPKSKKMLRIQLDLGFEKRVVMAGAAEHYNPDDLSGKKVVVLANLAPRTMMGIESQGMILMAEDRNGRLSLVESSGEDGAVVR